MRKLASKSMTFQFYISTIIIPSFSNQPSATLISILHKYDYNQTLVDSLPEGTKISILHKYDYNHPPRSPSRTCPDFNST